MTDKIISTKGVKCINGVWHETSINDCSYCKAIQQEQKKDKLLEVQYKYVDEQLIATESWGRKKEVRVDNIVDYLQNFKDRLK